MIYCVEDEESIQGMMVYTLNVSGYEAKGIRDGKELWSALEEEEPELILLDLNLPEEDGLSILNKLKDNPSTSAIPVIIASARGTEYDKVIGLDKGADDYLAKPFGMMEMVSRIKAVLRRCAPKKDTHRYVLGDLILDPTSYDVSVNGKSIKLTSKEYDILHLLIANPNVVFSREELFKSIWGQENNYESRTVDVHIGTLRSKLDTCSGYIETVRGVGYRIKEE